MRISIPIPTKNSRHIFSMNYVPISHRNPSSNFFSLQPTQPTRTQGKDFCWLFVGWKSQTLILPSTNTTHKNSRKRLVLIVCGMGISNPIPMKKMCLIPQWAKFQFSSSKNRKTLKRNYSPEINWGIIIALLVHQRMIRTLYDRIQPPEILASKGFLLCGTLTYQIAQLEARYDLQ
jgi:hypothetical protein